MVNLVDKQGYQKRLGDAFGKVHQDSRFKNEFEYVWFDYHAQCKGMKVQNCEKLLKSIQDKMDKIGWMEAQCENGRGFDFYTFWFILMEGELSILKRQTGVVRTNCIDCLDRSNVLQSLLGRHNLLTILTKENIISKPENAYLSHFPGNAEMAFRRAWVDHGNALSMLYAGTPALKTDFTLLGRRTWQGVLSDGKNGTTR